MCIRDSTKASLEMIPMIRDLKDDSSAILPAGLHMVEQSKLYTFAINCSTPDMAGSKIQLQCQKILALIKSTKTTQTNPFGDGFKLVTPGIEDLLSYTDTSGNASQVKHKLSAICTLANLPQYRLDPPRGGATYALVTITGKNEDAFVIESVQPLTEEQASQARTSLVKLLHFAMHMNARDRKRPVEWSESCSPTAARKCSKLGRSPTDEDMPEPPKTVEGTQMTGA